MGIAGLDALARHGYDIIAVFTHEDDALENCWFESVKKMGNPQESSRAQRG